MRIGGYEVEGVLGRGGMGAVFRVRSPSGELVALKLLAAKDGEKLARFERERRLLGEVSRLEGFVPLIDGGQSPEGAFLVMPLLAGGTLRDRLEKGPLGVERSLDLVRALARALGRAHAKGIVHRDLKPENVLFDARDRPLIADLGLAKHFDEPVDGAPRALSLSVHGTFRGTAGYAPPEQASDAKTAGPESDVFALGAILHECLSGRPAFAEDNLLGLLAKMARGDHDTLGPGEAPAWLASVARRALDPDPGARYADGTELLHALEAPRGESSRRLLVVVAAIVGVVATVALVARTAPAPPEPPAPKSAPTDADRRRVREALASPAAVSSAHAPWEIVHAAPDLERAAAERGVVYALDDTAAPGVNPNLRALALLGAGKRDEAQAILAASRPSGAALRIREAIVAASALETRATEVFGVQRLSDKDPESRKRIDELAATIPVLAHEPAELVATVLLPLMRIARKAAYIEICTSGLDDLSEFARGIAAPWDDRAFLGRLPPALLAAHVVIGDKSVLEVLDAGVRGSAIERGPRIFEPLVASDPLLAAAALLSLASRHSEVAKDERSPRALEAVRDTVSLADELALRPHAAEDDALADLVKYRAREVWGLANERIGNPNYDDESLRAFQRALEIAQKDRPELKPKRIPAARNVAVALLILHPDRLAPDAIDAVTFDLIGKHPLAAEILRRQGRPQEALSFVDAPALTALALERDWTPSYHGVRALVLADLGRLDEARDEVLKLEGVTRDRDMWVPGVTLAVVRARVARDR